MRSNSHESGIHKKKTQNPLPMWPQALYSRASRWLIDKLTSHEEHKLQRQDCHDRLAFFKSPIAGHTNNSNNDTNDEEIPTNPGQDNLEIPLLKRVSIFLMRLIFGLIALLPFSFQWRIFA